MLCTRVSAMLNRSPIHQLSFNVRAFSISRLDCQSSSQQNQDSNKTDHHQQQQQQGQQEKRSRQLGVWAGVAIAAGGVSYFFWSYRRKVERLSAASAQMRADLPSFSPKDVVERRLYVYGAGVYDLNDYARNGHPGGEYSIVKMAGKSFEEIWATEGLKFHRKREIMDLLEGMRVGNIEDSMDNKQERCKTPSVGEGALCLVPRVDAKEYRLEVTIDDGESLKALSLDELRRYPKHSIVSSIPCKNDPTKKEAGATWSGARLCDILRESKIKESEYEGVRFECLDSTTSDKPYGTTVPIDRVLSEADFDVLLAYEKDGAVISPQHGYPVRVVMPRAAGGRNVKWLHRVVLVRKNDRVA